MKRAVFLWAVVTAAGVGIAACGGGGDSEPSATDTPAASGTPSEINPADFQATVDNPFFPLSTLGATVFEGEETDPDTGETIQVRSETRVLPETDTIAGVEVTVVEDKNFEDGELVESTLDYYAQHVDGTVYYFGERVDDYENGEIVGHESQWLAGEGDNLPGIFMPANPQMGDEFEQERAPGVAEDRSKVIAVDQTVTTAAGEFSGCIKTEDYDPIGDLTEFKYYCPDAGFVREETPGGGQLDLISR